MNRASGRRVAERPPGRPPGPGAQGGGGGAGGAWSAVAALGLVLVTVAALFVAGSTDNATGPHPVAAGRTDVGARPFSCTGGQPGSVAVAGTLLGRGTVSVDGRLPRRPSFPLPGPVQVLADRAAAPSAYAVQSARTSRWLAAAPCPEPRATWWFVGAGAAGSHDTVLTVANPRPGAAIFDVDVFGPKGQVDAPALHGLTLASGATRTLDLARLAPASGDLAVRVRASRGLVAAGAAETWAPTLIAKRVHEWVAPQLPASRQQDLVGLSATGSATLLVANPTGRQGVVTVQVVGKQGTFKPTSHASLDVPGGTVREVDLSGALGRGAAAVQVQANLPVVATVRSVQHGDEAYATAGRHLDGRSVAGLPAGVAARLVLTAAGGASAAQGTPVATRAEVRVVGRGGRQLARRQVVVPAAGAASVALPRRAVAFAVSSTGGEIEGAVVLSAGSGVAAYAVAPPVTAQRSPGVLPAW